MDELSEEYVSSVCEIRDMENELIATGVLNEVSKDILEITAKAGRLPVTEFATEVKINIYNGKLGLKVVTGKVYTSSFDFIRITDLAVLTQADRRHFFRVHVRIRSRILIGECTGEKEEISILISDISLNGFRFTTEKALTKNEYTLCIRLNHCLCQFPFAIRRTQQLKSGLFQYGASFKKMDRFSADALCAFIFERQQDQIRRQSLQT